MTSWILVGTVLVAAVTGWVAFLLGARRGGPRPSPSIGEGLRAAEARAGRLLVVFVAADDAARWRLGPHPEPVLRVLDDPKLAWTVIAVDDGGEVARGLFEKHARAPMPPGLPLVLLLDARGRPIATGHPPEGHDVWLAGWLAGQPRQAVEPAP